MATEEITISELELADEVLADMTLPVDTATETRTVTLKQLRDWIGSSLPTGFIIPAVGKISDERFTLLDGKTLSRAGTYEAFCNKVVAEVQAGNWFACSEDEYNSDISTYGQCGKFVVSNDYIRIPKITRFIGATITLSEIGKTYKESLPNITGKFRNRSQANNTANGVYGTSGAFYGEDVTTASSTGYTMQNVTSTTTRNILFEASRSSSTYQNGAKVQPDHTKYPYYMVVSTEGQTAEVQIDINQVYEDLNLRATTGFSNVTAEAKKLVTDWGMPKKTRITLTPPSAGVAKEFTAPANGYFVLSVRGGSQEAYFLWNKTRAIGFHEYCVSGGSDTMHRMTCWAGKGDVVDVFRQGLSAELWFIELQGV